MLADEVSAAYDIEATHMRDFIAQLATVLRSVCCLTRGDGAVPGASSPVTRIRVCPGDARLPRGGSRTGLTCQMSRPYADNFSAACRSRPDSEAITKMVRPRVLTGCQAHAKVYVLKHPPTRKRRPTGAQSNLETGRRGYDPRVGNGARVVFRTLRPMSFGTSRRPDNGATGNGRDRVRGEAVLSHLVGDAGEPAGNTVGRLAT